MVKLFSPRAAAIKNTIPDESHASPAKNVGTLRKHPIANLQYVSYSKKRFKGTQS